MLEKRNNENAGFDLIFKNDTFKCAFITHSPLYSYGEISEMKRHNKTDEIFVLLEGAATMLTLEDGVFKEEVLSRNAAYNVVAGTWHYLAVSPEGKLFVTECADTDRTNTDTITLDTPYRLNP